METHTLTREQLIELLSPSPCSVEGHRRVDMTIPVSGYLDQALCLACQREQGMRERLKAAVEAERIRCSNLCFQLAKENVSREHRLAYEIASHHIKELGPTPSLDKLLAEARLDEAEWWLERDSGLIGEEKAKRLEKLRAKDTGENVPSQMESFD